MNMDQFRRNQVLQQQIKSAQEAEMRLSNRAAALKVRWSTHNFEVAWNMLKPRTGLCIFEWHFKYSYNLLYFKYDSWVWTQFS